jgi:hypothetical protein
MLLFCSISYNTENEHTWLVSLPISLGMLVNMLLPKRIIIKSKKHLEWVARNNVCIITGQITEYRQAHIRNVFGRGDCGIGTKGGDILLYL